MIKFIAEDLQLYHLLNQFNVKEQRIQAQLDQMGIPFFYCLPMVLRLPFLKGDPQINEEALEAKAQIIIGQLKLITQKHKIYVAVDGCSKVIKLLFFPFAAQIEEEKFYKLILDIVEETNPTCYIKMVLPQKPIIKEMEDISSALYRLYTFHEKYNPDFYPPYPYTMEEQVIRLLKEKQFNAAQEQTQKLLEKLISDYDGQRARQEILCFYGAIKRRLNKSGSDMLLPAADDLASGIYHLSDAFLLFHQIYEYASSKKDRSSRKLNIFQKKVTDYVEENYTREITLVEAANYIGFSEFYFSKLMKMAFEVSFIDYLATLRVQRAQLLLETTEKTITYISKAVGYENPNYFARLFKKKTGRSPRQYRYDNKFL